jgi:soluble lytic murein transglycosylase-like protein
MLRSILAAALLCAPLIAHAETSANFLAGIRSIDVVMTREPDDMRSLVDAAATSAGVPAHIARAVVRHESNYNPRLRGRAGEWGLGQIKCQTARSVGFAGPCIALFDPATNLRFSMAYLRLALNRGGAGCAGISLYQRGIGSRPACSAYGRAVMARAGR